MRGCLERNALLGGHFPGFRDFLTVVHFLPDLKVTPKHPNRVMDGTQNPRNIIFLRQFYTKS